MREAVELAVRVNRVLPRYVEIHDSIFKFSIRHAIPLPGIFKPIDYHSHYEGLYFLKEELEEIVVSLSNLPAAENEAEAQFVRVLDAYSNALLNTIV